ncbi:MAG: hypothetical protein MJE77_19175 [Proteobacteria bacterium]|nr:hypothetical protein [Pseudomonadota bacterium]
MGKFLATAILLAAVLGSAVPGARADDGVTTISLRFAERRGRLVVKQLGLSSFLFDQSAYRKLKQNPLATAVVVRLYVYRTKRDQPVSYRLITARIVYDLWEEKYQVRIDSPKGRDSGRFDRLDQAFKKITEFDDLPIADLADIPIGPHHYMAMIAELNPVSDQTQAEMRRWLSRPSGTTSLSRSTSFFGSFVSIFINTPPPEADRVVRVRSQPFYRVSR